jgi:hypothetical protein
LLPRRLYGWVVSLLPRFLSGQAPGGEFGTETAQMTEAAQVRDNQRHRRGVFPRDGVVSTAAEHVARCRWSV